MISKLDFVHHCEALLRHKEECDKVYEAIKTLNSGSISSQIGMTATDTLVKLLKSHFSKEGGEIIDTWFYTYILEGKTCWYLPDQDRVQLYIPPRDLVELYSWVMELEPKVIIKPVLGTNGPKEKKSPIRTVYTVHAVITHQTVANAFSPVRVIFRTLTSLPVGTKLYYNTLNGKVLHFEITKNFGSVPEGVIYEINNTGVSSFSERALSFGSVSINDAIIPVNAAFYTLTEQL